MLASPPASGVRRGRRRAAGVWHWHLLLSLVECGPPARSGDEALLRAAITPFSLTCQKSPSFGSTSILSKRPRRRWSVPMRNCKRSSPTGRDFTVLYCSAASTLHIWQMPCSSSYNCRRTAALDDSTWNLTEIALMMHVTEIALMMHVKRNKINHECVTRGQLTQFCKRRCRNDPQQRPTRQIVCRTCHKHRLRAAETAATSSDAWSRMIDSAPVQEAD